jgi:hypothetical protein
MRIDFERVIINMGRRHWNSTFALLIAVWQPCKDGGTACSVKPGRAGADLLKIILYACSVSKQVSDALFFVRTRPPDN